MSCIFRKKEIHPTSRPRNLIREIHLTRVFLYADVFKDKKPRSFDEVFEMEKQVEDDTATYNRIF
ncbi:hypothetical protein NTE_03042 [Candidatus Nitrososphaera evergladensis SR1]|jgi:hypothetical protein|uniref:Uncharacterized protein n=1 Tax=Candidatus Nitrososphaera evergladensis SR1 TaxID=1459636 RepID=A0A075MWQ4_9ARCH|nr:hypothetical protein [Candidatus Nitrososphaera evergladensis]AIF85077.1 hypothetical protein NTE_03042 [Candidatus Nitrososphaera evergladensis SR1]